MSSTCGRLVIAGAASGVGKTSLSLGLIRALRRRSLRVQPLKVGPDFLDPTYLSKAANRTCYNLDGWMTDRKYVERLFDRTTAGADVAVIEGVMGVFDGADPTSLAGSTAEIAAWLDAPVLLIVNVHGLARTLAAIVKGFVEFEPSVRIAGVLANQAGSVRHGEYLSEALETAGLPPLVGTIPQGALPTLQNRHLGLVTADRHVLPEEQIGALADACQQHLDLDAILLLARSTSPRSAIEPEAAATTAGEKVRIGVAKDEAFHFCYPDNLEAWQRQGAEMVPLSPLADATLPESLHGLYLPGGYPEEHLDRLSSNRSMRDDIRQFARSGKPVYAECGGLMYLGRAIESTGGQRLPTAGVLPIVTRMLRRCKSLGYVEASLSQDSLWGPAGAILRGHEFHYSEIIEDDSAGNGWHNAYTVCGSRRGNAETEGFQKGNILAGYVHLHWASNPELAAHFIARCKES